MTSSHTQHSALSAVPRGMSDNARPVPQRRTLEARSSSEPRHNVPAALGLDPPAHRVPKHLRHGRGLRYGEHRVMEAAEEVVHSFKHGFVYDFQQQAVQEFDVWQRNQPDLARRPERMEDLIHIFSRIFFMDRLKHVTFEWREGLLDDPKQGCFACSDTGGHGKTTIRMDPSDWHKRRKDDSRMSGVLGCLLHECAHSFLQLYGCVKHRSKDLCGYVGPCGHGAPWVYLAHEIQVAATKHLRCRTNLRVMEGVLKELRNGVALPANEWLRFEKAHPDPKARQQFFLYMGSDALEKLKRYVERDAVATVVIQRATAIKKRNAPGANDRMDWTNSTSMTRKNNLNADELMEDVETTKTEGPAMKKPKLCSRVERAVQPSAKLCHQPDEFQVAQYVKAIVFALAKGPTVLLERTARKDR